MTRFVMTGQHGQPARRAHSTPDPETPPPQPPPVPSDVPDPAHAPVQEPRQPEPPIRTG